MLFILFIFDYAFYRLGQNYLGKKSWFLEELKARNGAFENFRPLKVTKSVSLFLSHNKKCNPKFYATVLHCSAVRYFIEMRMKKIWCQI